MPCSGLGVIRRKPEIRFKPEDEIASLPEIQLDILRSLAACVKPGGTLLYSTCTLLERENEDIVRAFLEGAQGYTIQHSEHFGRIQIKRMDFLYAGW